jgi:hypothetical protein
MVNNKLEVEVEIAPATAVARKMRELESEIRPKIEVDEDYIREMRNQTNVWKLPEPVEIPADAIMDADQLGEWLKEKTAVLPAKPKKKAKSGKPKAKSKKKKSK